MQKFSILLQYLRTPRSFNNRMVQSSFTNRLVLTIVFLLFVSCRKTQYPFDKCMLDKVGIERPYVGYFSKARVHHTNRPKPEVHIEMPEPFVKHPTHRLTDPQPEATKRRPGEFFD